MSSCGLGLQHMNVWAGVWRGVDTIQPMTLFLTSLLLLFDVWRCWDSDFWFLSLSMVAAWECVPLSLSWGYKYLDGICPRCSLSSCISPPEDTTLPFHCQLLVLPLARLSRLAPLRLGLQNGSQELNGAHQGLSPAVVWPLCAPAPPGHRHHSR